MKFIKGFFIFFFVVILLALIAGLFMKKDFHVERSVVIAKPVGDVFDYVKYLKNQDNYSYWARLDPQMKKTYTGDDGTVGFVSAWEGNKDVGKGAQEITGIRENERIDYELRFIEPFETTNTSYMTTMSEGPSSTKVTWGMDGRMNYPMNVMMPFMGMDRMLGDQLQAGLTGLKSLMEQMPVAPPTPAPAVDSTKLNE